MKFQMNTIRQRLATAMGSLMAGNLNSGRRNAQSPLNQHVFKGTHNSYSAHANCGFFSCESFAKNHPPPIQMDDFGVWSLELDYNIVTSWGVQTAIVGHDGPGSTTDPTWGYTLADFLYAIKTSRSMPYRPVFVTLEKKYSAKADWDGVADPAFDDPSQFLALLEALLVNIFGEDNIFGPEKLRINCGWPSVPELAGKVIPRWNIADYPWWWTPSCPICESRYIFPVDIPCLPNSAGTTGCILAEAIQAATNAGAKLISADLYMQDWTFYGAPPDPLVVVAHTPPQMLVTNRVGDRAMCLLDPIDIYVSQQGTFGFPYGTVTQAANRAEPGWTILIKPGNYSEAITINIPLTVKNSDPASGPVVVGQ